MVFVFLSWKILCMKTIIRNFFSTLRRFKMAMMLNLLGLSVAFTAIIVIMIQVGYDLRFDSSVPDADNVYRIGLMHDGKRIAATPRPIGEGFAAYSPHVKGVAITNAMYATVFNRTFTIQGDDSKLVYKEKMMETTTGYIDVFHPEMIEGSSQSLFEPEKVLIPQSMAQRLFKGEVAIDKQLRGENFAWTVGGVYKDFPKNSSTHNFILLQLPKSEHWGLNYETYVHIDFSQNADVLLADYIKSIEPMLQSAGYDKVEFFLTPIRDIHFLTTIEFDTVEKTSMMKLWILISVALVILIIAIINFTNFSIALMPLRVKSINTQKVLGATQYALRCSMIVEAILISFLSFGFSLFLVYLVSLTPITNLLTSDLILKNNIPLLLMLSGIALLTGLFAGVYPALYATSFAPAVALKGNFGLSPRGRHLRSSLVGVQYVISFFLIMAALFMFVQMKFIQRSNPGYDRSQIISITANKQFAEQHKLFANELEALPCIESVGYSEALLSGRDHYDVYEGKVRETSVVFNTIRADVNFLQTIDISLTDGRYFTESDTQAENEYFAIFNEQARKEYDLQIGDKIDGIITVLGFIPDFNYASLYKKIEPLGFVLDQTRRFAYVRIVDGTNIYSAMQDIENTLHRLSPGYPFEIRPLDDISKSLYSKDNTLMLLITIFSLAAIILSMVGVFGMVIFENEYKRKEIGIRKVFGSSTKEILEMLNKRYISLLIICFVIAAPVAWFGISHWLQGFAYKTPTYWWVFVVTFLLVVTLTSVTVTFQSWRVANANPVDSIKTE